MKDAAVVDTKVATEKPKVTKTKEGTTVAEAENGAVKNKKEKAPRTPKSAKYRLIPGVDENTFRGQRSLVVKALKSLGEGFWTPEEVAAKTEGLQSKTPVIASVTFHLKGLLVDGKVDAQEAPVPVDPTIAETEAKETAAA